MLCVAWPGRALRKIPCQLLASRTPAAVLSQDRHKSLAVPCYGKVKERFQLNGDPVVCVTGSPTAARDDNATGSRAKRLPGVAASTIGGETCVPIFTTMRLTSLAL